MQPMKKIDVRKMMELGRTYAEAEKLFRDGHADKTDWDLYRFYWRNGAPKFSNIASEFEIHT